MFGAMNDSNNKNNQMTVLCTTHGAHRFISMGARRNVRKANWTDKWTHRVNKLHTCGSCKFSHEIIKNCFIYNLVCIFFKFNRFCVFQQILMFIILPASSSPFCLLVAGQF